MGQANVAAHAAGVYVPGRAVDIHTAADGSGRDREVRRNGDLEIHAYVIPVVITMRVDAPVVAVGIAVVLNHAHRDSVRRLLHFRLDAIEVAIVAALDPDDGD